MPPPASRLLAGVRGALRAASSQRALFVVRHPPGSGSAPAARRRSDQVGASLCHGWALGSGNDSAPHSKTIRATPRAPARPPPCCCENARAVSWHPPGVQIQACSASLVSNPQWANPCPCKQRQRRRCPVATRPPRPVQTQSVQPRAPGPRWRRQQQQPNFGGLLMSCCCDLPTRAARSLLAAQSLQPNVQPRPLRLPHNPPVWHPPVWPAWSVSGTRAPRPRRPRPA